MLEVVFLGVLGLLWVLFAAIQDTRTREIANWLNFSLIVFALGFRFFYSLFSSESFLILNNFFYQGLIGLAIFFVLGKLLYHGKLFAGGDFKLMMALGPVLGFSGDFITNIKFYGLFLVLFLFVGSLYGLVYSFVLSFKHFRAFRKEFIKLFRKNRNKFFMSLVVSILFLILAFQNSVFFPLALVIFLLPYFYVYAKAVDESCMIKKVKPRDLTEGDWLYDHVRVGGKTIKADWEGLDEKELALLKKTKKDVLIRQGIPYGPVFLISFLIFGAIWLLKITFMNIFGG